jgi:predicted DNA-binding protein (UPF0251 family)
MDLNSWIAGEKITQAEAARRLGISHGALHNLLTARRKPGGRLMAKIETATGGKVMATDFYSE